MKTIFFDFNGTIINDVDLCLNILNEMLKENGLEPITLERYREIFTFPIKKYYESAGFDFKKKTFEALSDDFIKLYQKASLECPLYDNVRESLLKLKNNGYRLVCLSASQIDNLTEQLVHFNIAQYFDAILGISNIYAASKVEIGKKYLEEHKINPIDAIMIGDTLHDKEVCDSMGIKCVLFDKGHQSHRVLESAGVQIISSYNEFFKFVGDYYA